ncbi:myristoylated alanine-rich C-kinase substrate-like [Asparagus officinalis]|uniref:myristoylated alanine-rich C-kinase substrate-like n=1 Tax=Asparagus officinalis TaxID=4686 RepID=UPI00098DF636|nr:myristoylated alanine-rich C-kinase substrate-like [Asparagus officinalis]
MTFLFCKWLIAANIVTRRRRVSDSEAEAAPRQATETTRETGVSTRGKETAESSRKGKEPSRPTDSEEEFDSEATETSEGEGETNSSSEEASGLPDSFFDRGLVCPSAAPTQSQAAPKKRKERVIMEYPNRMTAPTQASPRAELPTKYRHEGSEGHPSKKQKKAASKPRVHLPAPEETSGRSASSDEQGSQEEGEYRVEAASPGGMETEETSFVQQMQDALKEGPADVPSTPDIDPSATDAGPATGTDTTIITGTSDRPEEYSPKEPLNLDPLSSEALVEKVPDVAGASTATIPEPTLIVQEARLPSLGEPSHAEGSSIELGML